jgi:thiosulfate/3-mercaptopyruvate sulfurtransferase
MIKGVGMQNKFFITTISAVLLMTAAGAFAPARAASALDLGLIDAASLKGNPSHWVVLDGRPKSEWEAGHIPGAHSFCWENYTRTDATGVEYRLFSPKEFSQALGALGIGENTPVVVYGDADKSWGGEGWDAWVLSWLGHTGPIRLLNGGIQSWRSQGFPLVKGPEKKAISRADYRVGLKPELDISTEDLDQKKGSFVIVDVRSTLERLKGKVPGSIHISWEDFYSGSERRPLGPQELKKLLLKHGVDTSRPVVYYCYGGIRSSYAWLVHQLAGLPTARNYAGGMAAWKKRVAR